VLANRDFDRAELARRRQGAELEWKASLKQPRFVGLQAGARMLYGPDDPRRKAYEAPDDPVSDPTKLAAARDTLVRLPGRSIGFAGALTADEAQRFAATLLPPPSAEVPADLAPALSAPQAPDSRPRDIDLPMARLTQVYFGYGREGLSLLDPDEPASVIADHALGGHFNSRLMTTLRQEGGDTYGAGVVDLGGIDPGLYALATFTRTGNAAAVDTKLRDVLARLHRDGLTEEERALAAGNAVGSRAALRETPQQVLYTAMDEHSLGLPDGFFDNRAARAAALTLEQVNDFVRRFYDPAGFTMIRARPE
jgi:zinc protease